MPEQEVHTAPAQGVLTVTEHEVHTVNAFTPVAFNVLKALKKIADDVADKCIVY